MSIKDANGKKITVGDHKNMTKRERDQCEVRPFLRSFRVYNIDQTNMQEVNKEKYDKIIARFQPPKLTDTDGMYRNAAIDRMFERQEWLCRIQYDKASEQAYFKPSLDIIVLPLKAQFKISKTPDDIYKDGMGYYSTALHEMAHSTGTPERLDRNIGNRFGDAKYGKEELVAELSAAMVGNTMGFDRRIQNNNVAYVDSWLHALREEPKFIVSVMADVNKASNMILQKIDEQKLALGETPILGIQQEGKSEQTQNTSTSTQDQVEEVAKSTVKASIFKLPTGAYVVQASVNGQELDQKQIDNKTAVAYLQIKDGTKMDQMLSDIVKDKYGSELNLPKVNRNESIGLKI
jgi:antirestriction protein ArdC